MTDTDKLREAIAAIFAEDDPFVGIGKSSYDKADRVLALAAAPQPMGCGLPCGYDCNGACFDAAAPQPATPGQRMIGAAEEAVAIARGEAEPASMYPAETDWGPDVGKEVLPPYQPAPADREALVEVIAKAREDFSYRPKELGWASGGYHDEERAIADALLARGLRLPGEATMAWAVVGDGGEIIDGTVSAQQKDAEWKCDYEGERIVRVAIRVVEGGDDAA